MIIGWVENKNASVSSTGGTPDALNVRNEKRKIRLRQLGVQLAAKSDGISSGIAMISGGLIYLNIDTQSNKIRTKTKPKSNKETNKHTSKRANVITITRYC